MKRDMLVQRVLQACLDLGVRDFCVCAGSRNSSLIHGLLQHRHHDGWRLFPFFEERSAAFFALGRMQMREGPAAVLTTSGTAVAELLPAVIEAYYQARPLVLITADRPKRFRGSGAPQSIEQARLFGEYASAFDLEHSEEIVDLNGISRDRPIHLNVCLEEPPAKVFPVDLTFPSPVEGNAVPAVLDPENAAALEAFLRRDQGPLLVMVGCLEPEPAIIDGLAALNAPILADATSGLHSESRLEPLLLRGGDQTARRLTFTRVLRLGGVPSCRIWRDLETRTGVEVVSITERPFSGLARPSRLITCPPGSWPGWAQAPAQTPPRDWVTLENLSAQRLETLLEAYPRSEPACLRRLLAAVPRTARMFVGNSLPIRELSLVAARAIPWSVRANRGANGIDGNLSTFLGMASLAAPGPSFPECWGLFGDLTALYDLSSPAILEHMPGQAIRIVVINNNGGKIFRSLPNFRHLPPTEMKLVENPHRFQFQNWAAAWGLPYRRFPDIDGDLPKRVVIELRPDAGETEAFWKAWQQSCSSFIP